MKFKTSNHLPSHTEQSNCDSPTAKSTLPIQYLVG